jgi:hypothetical protein
MWQRREAQPSQQEATTADKTRSSPRQGRKELIFEEAHPISPSIFPRQTRDLIARQGVPAKTPSKPTLSGIPEAQQPPSDDEVAVISRFPRRDRPPGLKWS